MRDICGPSRAGGATEAGIGYDKQRSNTANALAEGWDQEKAATLIAATLPAASDDAADPANDHAEIARLARAAADIRAAFAARGVDRLSSDELAAYLGSLEDRPWPEYRAGKPITKAQVARLLKPLHASSGTIRPPNGTAKGYYRRAFDDAFGRYLSPENVTTSQPEDFCGSAGDFKTSHGNGCDVLRLPMNSSISAACDGVTDREALPDDYDFEERAAIREFDGGSSRAEAEWLARAEITAA